MKRRWIVVVLVIVASSAHAQDRRMPEAVIAATEPYVWESDATGPLRKVRPYTVEDRGQVEGEIAKAPTPTIPCGRRPEFAGKSRIGPYGDAIMELDYRDSLITFVGDEVAAVRWRQFRIYPRQFVPSPGSPAMSGLAGSRLEANGFPSIFNIEADPREEVNIVGTSAWVIAPYLQTIGAYLKSLERYPNPKAVHMTRFGGGQ